MLHVTARPTHGLSTALGWRVQLPVQLKSAQVISLALWDPQGFPPIFGRLFDPSSGPSLFRKGLLTSWYFGEMCTFYKPSTQNEWR